MGWEKSQYMRITVFFKCDGLKPTIKRDRWFKLLEIQLYPVYKRAS